VSAIRRLHALACPKRLGTKDTNERVKRMQSRFVRVCLSLIAVFLFLIVVRPLLQPNSVRASLPAQYKVVSEPCGSPDALQEFLNTQAKGGWELVPLMQPGGDCGWAVFKK